MKVTRNNVKANCFFIFVCVIMSSLDANAYTIHHIGGNDYVVEGFYSDSTAARTACEEFTALHVGPYDPDFVKSCKYQGQPIYSGPKWYNGWLCEGGRPQYGFCNPPSFLGRTFMLYFYVRTCESNQYLDESWGCKEAPISKQPPECPTAGDPIIVATGNSHQIQADYQSPKPFGLNFVRVFNSSALSVDEGIGLKWRHNLSRKIVASGDNAYVYRNNGQVFTFDGTNNWAGDVDIPDTLVELVDTQGTRTGWEYSDTSDNVELYNASGQLLAVTNRAGQTQTLVYDLASDAGGDGNDATLDIVTGFYGEALRFSYDSSQRIVSMTDPHGLSYQYAYDSVGNLYSVTYPVENGTNPVRYYHYEDENFPNNLTGITNEEGARYVTWTYDTEGRAISSELAGAVDKFTLDFSVDDQVTVTNPLGKQTTYHFDTIHDVKKVTQVEGHASANCLAANKSYSYDANGYLQSKTDWQGHTTTYIHNDRGLEESRTEAYGTPQARTITTEWETDFRLPKKITEPGKVTEFTYDAQGKLKTTVIKETE